MTGEEAQAQAFFTFGLILLGLIYFSYLAAAAWAARQATGLRWFGKVGVGIPLCLGGLAVIWGTGILVRVWVDPLAAPAVSFILAFWLLFPYYFGVAWVYRRFAQSEKIPV